MFDMEKVMGLGCDGAAAMSGGVNGVATLIKEKAPNSNYVHCNGHRLSLVLQKAAKAVAAMRDSLDVMEELCLHRWIP
jgi:hypothetical protein